MRTSKKYNRRIGTLFFVLPILVITAIGAYAILSLYQPGTLIVTAEYTNDQGVAIQMTVPYQIGTASGQTPSHLSKAPGTYTVTFGQLPYFRTPSVVQSSVPPGRTVYAVGAYVPAPVKVDAGPKGFNDTAITAMSNVTPVIWTDTSSAPVVLEIQSIGSISLQSGANFTHVFTAPGTFEYDYASSTYNGTITVV